MFTTNEVYSDNPSLKSQIQIGLNSDDIKCSEGMVLTLRPNGNLACVYESTAEKLQWDVLTFRSFQLVSPYDNESYPVSYRIMGGLVNSMKVSDEALLLDVKINSWDNGQLEILLPFGFIINEFREDVFVLIDNVEVSYSKILDELGDVILTIEFYENETDIRIITIDPV